MTWRFLDQRRSVGPPCQWRDVFWTKGGQFDPPVYPETFLNHQLSWAPDARSKTLRTPQNCNLARRFSLGRLLPSLQIVIELILGETLGFLKSSGIKSDHYDNYIGLNLRHFRQTEPMLLQRDKQWEAEIFPPFVFFCPHFRRPVRLPPWPPVISLHVLILLIHPNIITINFTSWSYQFIKMIYIIFTSESYLFVPI